MREIQKYREMAEKLGWKRGAVKDFEEGLKWVFEKYGIEGLKRVMNPEVKKIMERKELAPHLLFWAIKRTGSLKLADKKYLSFMKALGPLAGDWLWVVGVTKNLKALTHPKVLGCAPLLRKHEPIASPWFMVLARTGAVDELTSKEFWETVERIGEINAKVWLSMIREREEQKGAGKKLLTKSVMKKLSTLGDSKEIFEYLRSL